MDPQKTGQEGVHAPCAATQQPAPDWREWLGRVQRAAVRIDQEPSIGSGGEDILLVQGASADMMAAVEEAFAHFEVPLTPELRALYAETMGIDDPCVYYPCLPPPVLSGRLSGLPNWSVDSVESMMDTLHQWPMEDKAEGNEDVIPFLVLATFAWAFLVVGPNGRFTNTTYCETSPP